MMILKGEIDPYGYIRYGLINKTNDHKHILCHRLVLYQFKGFELKYTVNHIDGIKIHNLPKNLEAISSYENTQHAIKLGLKPSGEKHWKAVVTKSHAEQISRLIVDFKGDIHKVYDESVKIGIPCTKNIIKQILLKQNWKDVSDRFFYKGQFRHHITEEDVCKICKILMDNNFDVNRTTTMFNQESDISISKRVVYNIKKKFRWSHISDNFF